MAYRTIGMVIGTHGIKGEIKVKARTDFVEERFAPGKKVYTELNGQMQEWHIERARPHKGVLLVKLAEINDINDVETWRGTRLCIDSDQLQPLDDDEIYYHDLLHMQVETSDHQPLGEVAELLEGGKQLILRVRGDREVLIPYVKAFILQVDQEQRRLIVNLLEGM